MTKNASFIESARICEIKKIKNYSMADKNFSVTFHQNPKNDFLRMGLEKRTTINFEKKTLELSKKC